MVDDRVKGPLCFGSPKQQIPYMAVYAFSYEAVKAYVAKKPTVIGELFELDATEVVLDFIGEVKG